MHLENQASDAAASTEVTKIDPTLASIRAEREAAEAERARIQAEREEAARVRAKRALLGEVLNMQTDVEARFQAVKAQKKLLKSLREDLKALDTDDELTADELRALLQRGYEAYTGSAPTFHKGGVVTADTIIGILKGGLSPVRFAA
jgi:vacuolar-type H+-ATPase subunit E/Vma4